jgi:hypothetical protein
LSRGTSTKVNVGLSHRRASPSGWAIAVGHYRKRRRASVKTLPSTGRNVAGQRRRRNLRPDGLFVMMDLGIGEAAAECCFAAKLWSIWRGFQSSREPILIPGQWAVRAILSRRPSARGSINSY